MYKSVLGKINKLQKKTKTNKNKTKNKKHQKKTLKNPPWVPIRKRIERFVVFSFIGILLICTLLSHDVLFHCILPTLSVVIL
jgi:hypothetical protein